MLNSKPIVILHLSDLHFGNEGDDQQAADAKQLVLASLRNRIVTLDTDWTPDIVCITGDIAWEAQPQQYITAENWIGELVSELGLTGKDLFICPGNHDIERSLALPRPTNYDEADRVFTIPIAETNELHKQFNEYAAFCERLEIPKYLCGDVESYLVGTRQHSGLVFACHNSAWFARGKDLGTLWLGLPIVRHMEAKRQLPQLPVLDAKTVITLMHHPFSWLHDAENHQRELRKCSAEVLCHTTTLLLTGHTHDTVQDPTLLYNRCWHFPAGAAYDKERHFNAFRLIRINPPNIDQISYEYDPRLPDDGWLPKGEPDSRPLHFRPEHWQVIAAHPEIFTSPSTVLPSPVSASASIIHSPAAIDIEAIPLTESEREIDIEIKRTAELIKQGHTKQGQGELSQLYLRAKALKVNDLLLARIANNSGLCLLENDSISEAAEKFKIATSFAPLNALMFANLAQAQLRLGNFDEAKLAIEKARNLNKYDLHVLNVYSEYLVKSGNKRLFPSLFTELSTVTDDSLDWRILQGQLHFDAGNVYDAKKILQEISASEQTSVVKDILSRVLIEGVRAQVLKNMDLANNLPAELKTEITDAGKLLDDLIANCKEHDSKRTKAALHVNRAASRALLGQWDKALEDYDKVLTEEPQNKDVIKARLMALIGAKRFDEATTIASRQSEPVLSFALSQSLLDAGEYERAVIVLESQAVASAEDTLLSVRMQIAAWKKLFRQEKVDSLVKVLARDFPDSTSALCTRAEYAYDLGDKEAAVRLMEEAVEKANDENWESFAVKNLANLLLAEGQTEQALKVLESVDYEQNEPLKRTYVGAMYFAGRSKTALQLIEQNISEWKNDTEILSIFIEILESIGDFSRAIQFAKSLVEQAPANIGYRLMLARLLSVLGLNEAARDTLDAIDRELACNRAEFILPLAFQYRCLGFADLSIKLIFQAREKHFSNPDVHQAFITIFLSLPAEHSAKKKLETVVVDSVVTFTQDGVKHSYLIKDDPNADLRKSELAAQSSMAQLLLGKKVEEEVIVKEQRLEKSTVHIDSILSKYGYALSETLNKYSTWFPERTDIQKGDISQLAAVATEMGQQRNRVENILSFYKNNQMPLEMMANYLGTTLPQLWLNVINSPEMSFRTSFGTVDDLDPQHDAAATAQNVVLDTTAVLSVVLLEIEHLVASAFTQLLITGSVLTELESAIQDETISPKSQLPIDSTASENEQGRLSLLKKAQQFALSLAIHSTPEILDESSNQAKSLFGKTAVGSLLLAQTKVAAIYSDDATFRLVIRNEHGIKGFCSQTMLLRLVTLKIITPDQYTKLIAKLLKHRYWNLLVSTDDFLRAFKQDQTVSDTFKALAGALCKPCDLDTLAKLTVDFMTRLWLGGIPFATSDLFLEEMLKPICVDYQKSMVENTIISCLKNRFGHSPSLYALFSTTVRLAIRVRRSKPASKS